MLIKAKDAWKSWVKENKAKADGGKLNCMTCHQSTSDYTKVKGNAVDTFKKLGGK